MSLPGFTAEESLRGSSESYGWMTSLLQNSQEMISPAAKKVCLQEDRWQRYCKWRLGFKHGFGWCKWCCERPDGTIKFCKDFSLHRW